MSTVSPDSLAPLLLAVAAVIISARLRLFNAARTDRLLNLAVLLMIAVAALRVDSIQRAITAATDELVKPLGLYRLSEILYILSTAVFVALALTWRTRLHVWVMRAPVFVVPVASAIIVVLITSMSDPLPAAPYGGYASWAVAPSLETAPISTAVVLLCVSLNSALLVLLLVTSAREAISGTRGLPLAVSAVVTSLAVVWLIQTIAMVAAAIAAATSHSNDYLQRFAVIDRWCPLLYALGFTAVSAVPLVAHVVDRTGLDRYSRTLRKLEDLDAQLVKACPEIGQPPQDHEASTPSRYRLHLAVVRIRDAVMILSRYNTDEDASLAAALTERPTTQHAIRVQLAIIAKTNGATPNAPVDILGSQAADLLDDAAELVRLACEWTSARRLIVQQRQRECQTIATPQSTEGHRR